MKRKPRVKVPKKLYQTRLHRLLGIVSPSLFHSYLYQGDKEVVEFAERTGFFELRLEDEPGGRLMSALPDAFKEDPE